MENILILHPCINYLLTTNEKLQQTFQSLFASNIERVKSQRETENFPNKLHKPIRAHFCTKFLRENRDWLK